MNERRKYRRLRAEPAVQYKLSGEARPSLAKATGACPEQGRGADISVGGLRFLAERALKSGAELNLKIDLAGTGRTLNVAGRVCWQKKLKDRAYDTGIEFKGLTDEDKSAFTEFVFHEMHKRTGSRR